MADTNNFSLGAAEPITATQGSARLSMALRGKPQHSSFQLLESTMNTHALSELVFDFDIYPRGSVDSHHVSEIAEAMRAGSEMPPIVIDTKSKRIVDGFHRARAYLQLHKPDHKVQCVEKRYRTEKELFLDSARLNASHGRALTQHDKAHCLILAEKFGITPEKMAEALNITPARVGTLMSSRVGRVGASSVALKRTISHMAGRTITPAQSAANDKLSGMQQAFYANQLITLIENDLLDTENDNLMRSLSRLSELLPGVLQRAAA